MKRLNGVDALMLYSETPSIHMHTLKIGILDVSGVPGLDFADFEMFRRIAHPRLMALAALRYQLIDVPLKFHHPMWVQNDDIDLDYHLRQARVPPPGGRRELDQLIGEIASTPLDRRRPLWEMYVADGLADDRIAIIHKVHHVLADGVASANQMAKALRPDPPSPEAAIGHPADVTTTRLLKAAARDHARLIGKFPRLVSETAAGVSRVRRRARERGRHPDLARNFAPPQTFLNHVVTPGRRFATAPLSLSDVKETGRRLGVTLNDIVLATAAGALRTLLLRYDGHADAPLIAGVPVCTDPSPDRLTGNEFTYMTPSLPVHVDDPVQRVRLTAVATRIAKENHQLLGPTVLPAWLAYLPPALAPALFRRQAGRMESGAVMNLTISNVAGPRQRGYIEGGIVSEIYSVGPVVTGSGMNITVWSYVDQLAISVLTDDRTLDDPHEATDAILDSFAEIRAAAGLSVELTPVDAALPLAAAPG